MKKDALFLPYDTSYLWVATNLLWDSQRKKFGLLGTISEIEKTWIARKQELCKEGFSEIRFAGLEAYLDDEAFDAHDALIKLLKDEFIEEIRTGKILKSTSGDCAGVIEERHVTQEMVKAGNIPDLVTISREERGKEQREGVFWLYMVKADQKKLREFIDQYLKLWRNEQFVPGTAIRKASKQAESLVKKIYDILREHPEKGMLLPLERVQDADYLATTLFLESIGDISIKDGVPLTIEDNTAVLLIDVLPKFKDDFMLMEDGSVHCDFEGLITKDELDDRIVYDGYKMLTYKGFKHPLRARTFPFVLMQTIFHNSRTTAQEMIDVLSEYGFKKNLKTIAKDLQNFRRELRDKFGFDDSVMFFATKDIAENDFEIKTEPIIHIT